MACPGTGGGAMLKLTTMTSPAAATPKLKKASAESRSPRMSASYAAVQIGVVATRSVEIATLVYCSDQIQAAKWIASANPATARIARSRREVAARSRGLRIAASTNKAI